MLGPSTIAALAVNDAQKASVENFIEKTMPRKHEYEVNDVFFVMMQPPVVGRDFKQTPLDILKTEMGQTEVTQELFEAVMGWNESTFLNNPPNPVENVTWFDCISFCNKLSELLGFQPCYEMADIRMSYRGSSISYARATWDEAANGFRLPTEYEWESFAKAGTQNRWAGTDEEVAIDDYVWHEENSGNEIHPVGEKLPNEWGLYDMSGNVLELCWDMFGGDRYYRAVRGGSYWNYADNCRVADRNWLDAGHRYSYRGFRICRTIK